MEGIKIMEKHRTTYQFIQFLAHRVGLFMILLLVATQGYAQSARSYETVSPELSLRSTSLSAMQFTAYSDRALEKVGEWLTYMSLLQESRQDSLLYAELSGYVGELYLEPDVLLIFGSDKLKLENWLEANQNVETAEVMVSRHEWIDDWAHNGERFERHLMVNLAVLEGESPAWAGERILTIYLTRINKDFGGEAIETWEIRLGEME